MVDFASPLAYVLGGRLFVGCTPKAVLTNNGTTLVASYTYDAKNRITSYALHLANGSSIVSTFTYTPGGFMQSASIGGYYSRTDYSFKYDSQNRLTSYAQTGDLPMVTYYEYGSTKLPLLPTKCIQGTSNTTYTYTLGVLEVLITQDAQFIDTGFNPPISGETITHYLYNYEYLALCSMRVLFPGNEGQAPQYFQQNIYKTDVRTSSPLLLFPRPSYTCFVQTIGEDFQCNVHGDGYFWVLGQF